METKKNSFLTKEIIATSLASAFKKFNPVYMIKNPVMFVVEIGFFLVVLLTAFPSLFHSGNQELRLYNGIVAVVLFLTILFANFAESVAQGRGKAQVATLKKTKSSTSARVVIDGKEVMKPASTLSHGDIVIVRAGETIPNDGEVIDGIATVDESAITGESAPVIKERGGDFSSVTGGTVVTSDELTIKITSLPGESFLDKMISLIEGANRKKTPNEIALSTLLVSLTIIFLLVVLTLYPMLHYLNIDISIATLVALTVCLIPTTIGGLLSAIGIAGMDRVTQFNVIAMNGKAVEACGDVDTLILDKTGTITYGNRMATAFLPVSGIAQEELKVAAYLSSLTDDTPEGKSIVALAKEQNISIQNVEELIQTSEHIPFTAQTRMSGLDTADGTKFRKGAYDVMKKQSKVVPKDLEKLIHFVSNEGGTPLVVMKNEIILGVIYLKDVVKSGLKERFKQLREMGIQTIMCTGDNPLTAAAIAKEAGVDSFIAESKPEDKIQVIRDEQKLGKVVAMTGDGTNDAPALAQANVGMAMNSGTNSAKEAANMVDLDSDPTKLIEVVEIGKQLLMTRGALTTFSIANDIAKYFAIIPAILLIGIPEMSRLNIMHLDSPISAILSALIFNALIIPLLIPVAMKGVQYKAMSSSKLLIKNTLIYGVGGAIVPFIGIKIIDMIISPLLKTMGI
ncbi:potassium-transporting ATPase subunit KdpB [Rummeliibacillus suwonensis]|uniref:potassium-transporting ATPase subunit KdpB n=1 Tax=Rummeliibacillus suwonensis TaxID=1306154 RepID=UPI0011B47960|nr:potassium-transporting ATPase subunit KdpB [Rummeliibacillus suwonensis]MBO2535589.1 potassium-transporting ATPase subunit KdpB [Rummeliibacillus suwonensis]